MINLNQKFVRTNDKYIDAGSDEITLRYSTISPEVISDMECCLIIVFLLNP